MKVVILAAGRSSRLFPLTQKKPKPLIKVAGIPLLEHSFDFVRNFSPSEVIIVCGYRHELMKKYILRIGKQFSYKIRILTNPKITPGNIHSLKIALSLIRNDFLLMNADHIYYNRKIGNRVKNSIKKNDFFAVCDFDRILKEDDMKIKTTKDKREILMISKTLADHNGGYTGVTFCSKRFLPKYQYFFKLCLKNGNKETTVESILQRAAREKYYPQVCDISYLDWLEIDTLKDLKRANQIL